MYGIALSASACLRAGTRVDIAWVLDDHGLGSFDVTDAVALTPGGGRFGALLDGALDSQLIERVAQQHSRGRLLEWEVSTVDALIAGLPAGGRVQCVLVSGEYFPAELWPVLEARQPFAAVLQLGGDHGDEVTGICVVAGGDRFGDVVPSGLVDAARGRLQAGEVGSTIVEGADGRAVIAVFAPTRRLVVSGGGPIVDALRSAAALLGWKVVVVGDPDSAVGLMATLSALDDAVVMGHDVESSSRVLAAALEGGAGYLGALGSQKMQQQRADWLAYRGVTDLERVHGPAGLHIGASTPAEIAVSILAEIIAVRHG